MSVSTAVLKAQTQPQTMSTGLKDDYRAKMSATLSEILASTYQLTIKSHIYHWNVVGPLFKPLHELTEEHYNALFQATDVIAERIRALGHLAPVTLKTVEEFAPKDKAIDLSNALEMTQDLIAAHEKAVRTMRDAAEEAGDAGDVVTEDMLTAHLSFHEKAIWMLKAIIAE